MRWPVPAFGSLLHHVDLTNSPNRPRNAHRGAGTLAVDCRTYKPSRAAVGRRVNGHRGDGEAPVEAGVGRRGEDWRGEDNYAFAANIDAGNDAGRGAGKDRGALWSATPAAQKRKTKAKPC